MRGAFFVFCFFFGVKNLQDEPSHESYDTYAKQVHVSQHTVDFVLGFAGSCPLVVLIPVVQIDGYE